MTATEPPVISDLSAKDVRSSTKITFYPDMSRFSSADGDGDGDGDEDKLFGDLCAIAEKRAVDMAGIIPGLTVIFNGTKYRFKDFAQYIAMYVGPDADVVSFKNKAGTFHCAAVVNDSVKKAFKQVAFVNGIHTVKGGTLVDYVVNQLYDAVSGKKYAETTSRAMFKTLISVFVNARIPNPAFDGQSKEKLVTTLATIKGSTDLALPASFAKKLMASGDHQLERLLTGFKKLADDKKLATTDGKKRARLSGYPTLEDAHRAGSSKDSAKCTLILTEGLSAKTSIMSGLKVVGRDYYGVFPLKGKILNVRGATADQIVKNVEITAIKEILGLVTGTVYDETNIKSLRYGRVMIATDADVDGSHIKGLILNLFATFWPAILENFPGFVCDFRTPVIKATKRGETRLFYSIPEFNSVKDELATGWHIKYYKGLGTSTSAEMQEYFKALNPVPFNEMSEQDAVALGLAFAKENADLRKDWLAAPIADADADDNGIEEDGSLCIHNFVHKQLIHFSRYDNTRSIPSMVDGLKTGQRKILFAAYKKNLTTQEMKVAQFASYVAGVAGYHHGEVSLCQTIVGMAQNYPGTNNVPLFEPRGQFGSRFDGGKDAAQPRYIFTLLSKTALEIYQKEDLPVLKYLEDDGQSVEPEFYVPIVPMILVNGAHGIGTGWSTNIPCFSLKDVAANVARVLDGKTPRKMLPHYEGFRGHFEHDAVSGGYSCHGSYERVSETEIRITEIPIQFSFADYKMHLLKLQEKGVVRDFLFATDETFTVYLAAADVCVDKDDLVKVFKLKTLISINNLVAFDSCGALARYERPEHIIVEFCNVRLKFFKKRRKHEMSTLAQRNLILANKIRFASEYDLPKIKDLDDASQIADLETHEYDRVDGTFDYLLGLNFKQTNATAIARMEKEKADVEARYTVLEQTSSADLFRDDVNRFLC